MDEEVRPEKKGPLKSVVIQSANLEDPNHGKKFLGFPGSQEHYGANQIVIPMDGKPSNLLILISLIIIFISTGGTIFSIDSGPSIDSDLLCCFLCNGNAIGLIMLGVFNTQYGRWKGDMGSTLSSNLSYLIAILFFVVAIVFIVLWLLYFTSSY